ncbi:uncharacterized protein STEHIDRAFT_147919 [Stereum hirsutum FP-91666 SS1]|uniref:uncharacterized protein n=1 Tax=Stereum hirsutum (strain FP-91666) TaxID=721885 RepID=UPI000444A8FD|nr:uncharacterized protein STEHIDRAFT_147919 [Stereum hirsutum FP-91666 SS1]EIM85565.1 hypothetical protein STEHIDRAFT_147919 [Stereum hirsutum FP-91666 SS1]
MSFSVDDLVSSFNAAHVGQEARDLAALQAQLAQTLLWQMPAQSSSAQNIPRTRKNSVAQPCTTPAARTPSTGFFWDSDDKRRRSSSVASRRSESDSAMEFREEDMEMDDERMVENLLLSSPTSPQSASRTFSQYMAPAPPHRPQHRTSATFTSPSSPYEPSSHSQSSSLFTTTDPFYLATVQHQHQHAAPSFFAQAARPGHNSPFMPKPPVQTQSSISVHGMSMDVDSRPMLVSPAGPGMGMYND